jgi:hypothetical protein
MRGAAKAKVKLIRQILAEHSEPRSRGPMFRDMIAATLMRMPTEALEELARWTLCSSLRSASSARHFP